MVFIGSLLKDQLSWIYDQEILRSINATNRGWGARGRERAGDQLAGNATSVTTQVKNEFNREAIPAHFAPFRDLMNRFKVQ